MNRKSTRADDPDICFHTLAIDIWGPVNTPSIGSFSYVFGERIKTKSDLVAVFRSFYVKFNYMVAKFT